MMQAHAHEHDVQHEPCCHDHQDGGRSHGHGHGHAHEEHILTEGESQGTPPPGSGHLTARANAAAEAGEFMQAAALFRQARALDPANAADLEALAQCLLETGDAPGAAEAATAALRRRPEWAVAHLTLARAQLNAGAFGAAARAFRDAVALDGSLAEEAQADLETAQRLQLAQDERELVVNGVALRLQQWRGDDGGGHGHESHGGGGGGCTAVAVTPRHGTGTMIWECSIVLAGYLMHRPAAAEQLRGKRVIELGAGAGVAGLAASALGAHAVLTDLEPVARLLRCNVGLNREALLAAGGSAEVVPLDWNDAAARELSDRSYGLVLGADLVFQPDGRQLPGLVALLRWLLAPAAEAEGGDGPAAPGSEGPQLLLAHKSRHAELDEQLVEQLRAAGISLSEILHAEHHPDYRSPSVRLFSGRRIA